MTYTIDKGGYHMSESRNISGQQNGETNAMQFGGNIYTNYL